MAEHVEPEALDLVGRKRPPRRRALKPSIAETDDSACLNYSAGRKRL
jgi:hypothetical protein